MYLIVSTSLSIALILLFLITLSFYSIFVQKIKYKTKRKVPETFNYDKAATEGYNPQIHPEQIQFEEHQSHEVVDIDIQIVRNSPINITPDILIPCSGPIDEYNTTNYIPTSFSQVASLLECTHDGKIYFDDYNEFGLEIPKGAIPLEMIVSIDIGVALYGPLQYPKGLRPVSPIFWVCVRDRKHFQFLKPVKVTIPHFLNLKHPEERTSLGLTFLKAEHEMNSHQMYQFNPAQGDANFEPFKTFGILEMTHFCSLCIASEDSMETIKNANFCMSAVIPRMVPVDRSAHAYFFLSFLLKTCISTLKTQITKCNIVGELEGPEYFQFKGDNNQALEIICPKNQEDWIFGVSGQQMVCTNIHEIALVNEIHTVCQALKSDALCEQKYVVVANVVLLMYVCSCT